jgi:hypothetical protein
MRDKHWLCGVWDGENGGVGAGDKRKQASLLGWVYGMPILYMSPTAKLWRLE